MRNAPTLQGWIRKFHLALGGIAWAVKGEYSFRVQLPMAVIALLGAAMFRFDPGRWALLVLTIGLVLTAELFNTALESLAKAIDVRPNEHIRRALDISSGAVLCSSLFAAGVGVILFWRPLWNWLT